MPLETAEHHYREDHTHTEDDRPKNVAWNVGIERPDEPSETALLGLLECLGWCPFQHGRLRSPALLLTTGKLEGAIGFRERARRSLTHPLESVGCQLDGDLTGSVAPTSAGLHL